MSAPKIVLSLLSVVFSLFLFTSPALAGNATADKYDYFAHAETTVLGGLAGGVAGCGVAGINFAKPLNDPSNPNECWGYSKGKLMTYDWRFGGGGAIGALGSATVALYANPPTSTTYYLANLGENLGIGPKTAYAQVGGSGNGIISPVLAVWTVARNVAYLFFIAIFLVVGIMIMLRQKINPQTVISIQQALPSLVIGLFLVTFSYFIAALLVDMAFVGIQLVTQLFIQVGGNSIGDADRMQDLAQNSNVFQFFSASGFNLNNLGIVREGVATQLNSVFGDSPWISSVMTGVIAGIIASLVLTPLGGLVVGGATALAVPVIIPVIVITVLLVALLIQMFRLLFGLIGTYIQILIFTIAGPLYILVGSIPGRGGVISMWWKGLLGNALVFPAVLAAFFFAGFILGPTAGDAWKNASLPFFGNVQANFVRTIIAFGILLGTPSIPDMVRKALGVSGPQGFAQAALGGFMGGVGVVRGGGTRGYNAAAGNLRRQREIYQKEVAESAVTGNPAATGGVPLGSWRERLFRRGLPW